MLIRDNIFKEWNTNIKIKQSYYYASASASRGHSIIWGCSLVSKIENFCIKGRMSHLIVQKVKRLQPENHLLFGVSHSLHSIMALKFQETPHRILNFFSGIGLLCRTPLVKRFGQPKRKTWGPNFFFLLIKRILLSINFLDSPPPRISHQLGYQNKILHVEPARRLKWKQFKDLKCKFQSTRVTGNQEP